MCTVQRVNASSHEHLNWSSTRQQLTPSMLTTSRLKLLTLQVLCISGLPYLIAWTLTHLSLWTLNRFNTPTLQYFNTLPLKHVNTETLEHSQHWKTWTHSITWIRKCFTHVSTSTTTLRYSHARTPLNLEARKHLKTEIVELKHFHSDTYTPEYWNTTHSST